jgi:hypothetical protein
MRYAKVCVPKPQPTTLKVYAKKAMQKNEVCKIELYKKNEVCKKVRYILMFLDHHHI